MLLFSFTSYYYSPFPFTLSEFYLQTVFTVFTTTPYFSYKAKEMNTINYNPNLVTAKIIIPYFHY